MVLSTSPAEARASTNPDKTSVSKDARSSSVVGARNSRRSRTAARPTPHPRTSPRLNFPGCENDSGTESEKCPTENNGESSGVKAGQGYPSEPTSLRQGGSRQGRLARRRSKLGGWPRFPGGADRTVFGLERPMSCWY